MAKYIPDSKSHRWVILAPGRLHKPHAKTKDYRPLKQNGIYVARDCPFCLGNEHKTPPEIDSIKKNHLWSIRVIPNKYPITDIHEVIIHSPDHNKELEDMTESELLLLFLMYQKRLKVLSQQGMPILFRNKGEAAGTSIPHPHSQIILLPSQINLDALYLEPIRNIVKDNENFVVYCPDFSQYPYEVWIAHKTCCQKEIENEKLKEVKFTSFSEQELLDLGKLLQLSLRALKKTLGTFSYNYYISPLPPFYLRIIPRILTRGGFEIGTGLSTNVLDPASAAEELKKNLK